MKRLISIITAFFFIATPMTVFAQSEQPENDGVQREQAAPKAPPISQTLIPEGDFALKLAPALKLGTATTAAQAEDILTSAGITPKKGWIADYPMTPIVIGELQSAVVAAAGAGKIPMEQDEALKTFQGLTGELGLAVVPGSGQYAATQPPTSPQYVQPSVVNNYYYQEGPPVVTYYAPPPDYYYLYAWVPYPFFYFGFYFPGFFILNDFDIVVTGHHFYHGHFPRYRITNHFFDRRLDRYVRVDPTMRTIGRRFRTSQTYAPGFRSPEARRGAASIYNRSLQRARSANPMPGVTGRRFEGTVPRATTGRTFSQPRNFQRQSRNIQRPFTPEYRNFSAPSGRGFGRSERFGRTFVPPHRAFGVPPGRSFNRPPEGFGRSFSSPSRSFNAPRSSFGGFHEGFHGGGFGGRSFGGGMGRR